MKNILELINYLMTHRPPEPKTIEMVEVKPNYFVKKEDK